MMKKLGYEAPIAEITDIDFDIVLVSDAVQDSDTGWGELHPITDGELTPPAEH
ncbi:MAG: hypothetical protein ACI3XR_07670 [Eubacteriales bacterium]